MLTELNIRSDGALSAHLAKPVIPIRPFLEKRLELTGDPALKRSLGAMKKGFIPNLASWNERFKTNPLKVLPKPSSEGRYLYRQDEEVPE